MRFRLGELLVNVLTSGQTDQYLTNTLPNGVVCRTSAVLPHQYLNSTYHLVAAYVTVSVLVGH